MNDKEWLVEYLRKLGHGEVLPKDLSGCLYKELDRHISASIVDCIANMVVERWPLFSGWRDYPVFYIYKRPTLNDPVAKYLSTNNKWVSRFYHSKKHKKYIKDHLDLCLWVADNIECGKLDEVF